MRFCLEAGHSALMGDHNKSSVQKLGETRAEHSRGPDEQQSNQEWPNVDFRPLGPIKVVQRSQSVPCYFSWARVSYLGFSDTETLLCAFIIYALR